MDSKQVHPILQRGNRLTENHRILLTKVNFFLLDVAAVARETSITDVDSVVDTGLTLMRQAPAQLARMLKGIRDSR